jgi:HPt (histidine-containing phosphotransfer) domain-containing protein
LDQAVVTRWVQMMGSLSIFADIIRVYLAESAMLMQEIEAGCSVSDWKRLQYGAHTLKSSSANLGGVKLAGVLESIERVAKEAMLDPGQIKPTHIAAEVGKARRLYTQTCFELRQISDTCDAPGMETVAA